MPQSTIKELIVQLTKLEAAFTQHLIEGSAVKSDIRWLKWLCMLIVGGLIGLFFKQ